MEENISLETLIQEHKGRIPKLRRHANFCSYSDMDNYHIWLATTKRYLGSHYPQDKDVAEFERISKEHLSPNQQNKLLGILEAFAKIPAIIPDNLQDKKGMEQSRLQRMSVILIAKRRASNKHLL